VTAAASQRRAAGKAINNNEYIKPSKEKTKYLCKACRRRNDMSLFINICKWAGDVNKASACEMKKYEKMKNNMRNGGEENGGRMTLEGVMTSA
jgi:hypothetical protein